MGFLYLLSGKLKNIRCFSFSRYVNKRDLTYSTNKKTVYVSLSNNIFTNLALENWLYQNYDFKEEMLLLLWINNPCVVIGRHQNPWVEVNFDKLFQYDVQLARRNSGGGTVYHDTSNLNLSFFSSRSTYNRKHNLQLICQVLQKEWNLNVKLSEREDIVLNDAYKISGTASKLGHKTAYHHCTLLVDVDSSRLHQILTAPELGIESNATASVRSPILNLSTCSADITMDQVSKSIGNYFLKTGSFAKSTKECFTLVNPLENDFPGLNQMEKEFSNWLWVYGKTPRFTIQKSLGPRKGNIKLEVHRGLIETLDLSRSGISESDSKKWTEFLLNRKLDKQLYETILNYNNSVEIVSGEPNVEFKSFLLTLCPMNM